MITSATLSHFPRAIARLLAVLFAGLSLAPAGLGAQEAGDTASLPEIVVTATRYPVTPDSVASSVTVLRGDDIRAQGIRLVGDALRQVPGVHMVQSGPYGAAASAFVRGGESDYVKVLVDGIPVNQPGGFYDFASLTTDNVERIEILRGPGSVLYGSDAIAGVVQIVTRQGDGGVRLGASGEGGSFGTARWEASALGGSDRLGWSASLSRLTSDGTYDFNNDYRNTAASGRFRTRLGERTDLSLTGRYHDAKYNFPTDFTGIPVDVNQFTTDETAAFGLDVGHRFSEVVEGRVLLGRSDIETSYQNPIDPPGPGFASDDRTSTDRSSADARVQLTLPRGIRGLAGASVESQRQDVTGAFRESRRNWGLYTEATFLPVSGLQITAGGRLDENEKFGSFWTYRATALAFASPTTKLRTSVGTGFKEPGFFENFDSPFSVGNPDLRPERSFSVEGGVEQDLAQGAASVGVTVFAQRFRDLIQFTFVTPTPGGPNYFNVASANANGIEAVVGVRPRGPVRGSVSYTRIWSEVTDAGFDSGDAATFVEGERLLRRPSDALSLRVETAVADRARLGAMLSWVGTRDDIRFGQFPEPSQRVELPSYTTLDLSGTLTVLHSRSRVPGLDLTARVENLFDERYEQVVGFPARGRGIFVGVSSQIQ